MKIFLSGIKTIIFCTFIIGAISVSAQKGTVKKKHHLSGNPDSIKGAGYFFDAAGDKVKAGDCVAAIDLYDKCISIDPETPDAYYNRALCKMQLQDYVAAIADFTTCIGLRPKAFGNALYLRGTCFNQLKRYDMAITDFTKALEVSSNADTYAARGFAYMQIGDFGNALSDYNNAIKRNGTTAEWYGQRAICQYRERHLKEAVDDAEKFLAEKPNSPEIVEVKLRAEIEMQNYTNALKTAQNLINLEKSPKAYYYKGMIEYSQGKYKDGVTDFTSAIQLDTTYKDAWYSRSLCYISLKDDANACKDLRKARQLGFPNLEGKIEATCKGQK